MRGSLFPPAKTMRGSLFPLFPLFWWPMSIHPVKTWTTKIGEIGEIGTLSWFWRFTLRGNPYFPYFGGQCLFILSRHRGNRGGEIGTLHLERAPISPILVANVYSSCQDMDHQNRGNRGNRDPLMVLALHP